MVHSVSGGTRGAQVKLWDPLRTRAIPERLRCAFTTLYKSTFTFTFTFISPVRKICKYGRYYSCIPFNSIHNHLRKVSIVQLMPYRLQYALSVWTGFLSADLVSKRSFMVMPPIYIHLRNSVMMLTNVFLERYIMNITVFMISSHHYLLIFYI